MPRSCRGIMGGHASAAFTLDRYGHLFPDHEDELMERLDEVGRYAGERIDAPLYRFRRSNRDEARPARGLPENHTLATIGVFILSGPFQWT
jgi:hypothetical protein